MTSEHANSIIAGVDDSDHQTFHVAAALAIRLAQSQIEHLYVELAQLKIAFAELKKEYTAWRP